MLKRILLGLMLMLATTSIGQTFQDNLDALFGIHPKKRFAFITEYKSPMKLYQDSLDKYNRHQAFREYCIWRLNRVETLGEYLRVSDSLGFGNSKTQKEEDVKPLGGNAVNLTKDDELPYELIVHLEFGNKRYHIDKDTYLSIVKKPTKPKPVRIAAKTKPKPKQIVVVIPTYDTLPKKFIYEVYHQHNYGPMVLISHTEIIDSTKVGQIVPKN